MVVTPVRRGFALLGAAALAAAMVAGPAAPASAAVACEVSYTAQTWSTGFYGDVRIKNLGDTWNGWTLQFTFPGNQQIISGWNNTYTQIGHEVIIRSGPWAPPVEPGQTLAVGFAASYSGVNAAPTNWRVNGVRCTVAGHPPAVVAEPTTGSVPEGGGGSLTVRLSHPPSGTVYLGMTMQGTGVWASPPVVLVFTPTNWSNPQSYPVMSQQDQDDVDDVAVFTLTVPGYQSDTVTFTQIDDD